MAGCEWSINDLSVDAYGAIVSMPASQMALMNHIEPGEPDSSYLWLKMLGTQIENNGSGLDMPKARIDMDVEVLSACDLARVQAWILDGAPM